MAVDGEIVSSPSARTVPGMDMREQIRDELRSCVKRGLYPPRMPKPEDLWEATNGDGPLAVLVMLDYLEARRAFRQEQADKDAESRVWRSRAA